MSFIGIVVKPMETTIPTSRKHSITQFFLENCSSENSVNDGANACVLHEKFSNSELILVRIFPHLD